MTDESYSFTAAKSRLEEIVTQVRKKDTSLEKSLDLLEEGVRLANVCTELIDHADWVSTPGTAAESVQGAGEMGTDSTATATDPAMEGESGPEVEDTASDDSPEPRAEDDESSAGDDAADAAIGDVWSEDEAWADETQDDPSDGDDGHGD